MSFKTFEFFDASDSNMMIQVENITTKKRYPHQTAEQIIAFDKKYRL